MSQSIYESTAETSKSTYLDACAVLSRETSTWTQGIKWEIIKPDQDN